MSTTIIIGGVAGGASCAARLRRLDENRNIILLERGPYISYANCGLPYHVGNVIPSRSALLVTTKEMLEERFRIDVRTRHEAVSINREKKTVTVRDLEKDSVSELSYDELVLATGSSPIRPSIPGIESDRIHTLWTVPDADAIRKAAMASRGREAAVIGGGFIGLEIAENLAADGLHVTVLEGAPQVLSPLDPEMARLIEEELLTNGVNLVINDPVESFEEQGEDSGKTVIVHTKNGKNVRADFVILSIGIRPNTKLAKDCGLTVNQRGYVVVSDQMETSDPDIFAVGDIVETRDATEEGRISFHLAGPANKQGRIAAEAIAWRENRVAGTAGDTGASDAEPSFAFSETSPSGAADFCAYRGSQGTSIAKAFGLAAGMTGKSEKVLVREGRKKGTDYDVVYVTQNQHAGYYPGAVPMTIKVIYAADGSRILGAQIVGMDGVDKRIDVISAAIRLHAKATDLADLECAYAPPFSSAKDPVNMAGFMIRNRLLGLISYAEWDSLEKETDLQILDVREDAERLAFVIPGAVPIPLGKLRENLEKLDPRKKTVVFCSIGVRAYSAARILLQHGFADVRIYPGGSRFYVSTHYWKFFHPSDQKKSGGTREAQGSGTPGSPCEECEDVKKVRVDCNGMQCPGPLMRVFQEMKELKTGELLEVTASDPGFTKDIVAWCRQTGNTLLSNERRGTEYVACIRKGTDSSPEDTGLSERKGPDKTSSELSSVKGEPTSELRAVKGELLSGPHVVKGESLSEPRTVRRETPSGPRTVKGETLVVFSGEMDRVMASLVIANGAAAMGKPVTMFFTFWGLAALRRRDCPPIRKTSTEKMFGAMLPSGISRLPLSKLNMGGLGKSMMERVMRQKNIDSVETLLKKAIAAGVRIIACSMSMEVMGIRKEELIDGVEVGGVGTYLGASCEADGNLFI